MATNEKREDTHTKKTATRKQIENSLYAYTLEPHLQKKLNTKVKSVLEHYFKFCTWSSVCTDSEESIDLVCGAALTRAE